jgi:hypothetical protein
MSNHQNGILLKNKVNGKNSILLNEDLKSQPRPVDINMYIRISLIYGFSFWRLFFLKRLFLFIILMG